MSIGNNVTKKSLFKNSKVWFFLAGAAAVIAAVFVFFVLQSVTATTTYYVLNKDIPARTQITSDLLTPVTTSEGGQPRTALTPGSLAASGQIYSKYALSAGDVVTPTNAGSLTALTKGLPSNYVVASFKADPSIAAGGQVARGDYIDVIAVSDTDSHVFLQRVLVVNATTDLDAGGATADSSGTTTSGDGTTTTDGSGSTGSNGDASASTSVVPTLFTVGISQEDAAKLAVVSKNFSLYVVLSSADSSKNGAKSADVGAAVGDIFSGAVGDSGQGTDNTFGDEASKKSTSSSSTDSSSDSSSSAPSDSATAPTDSSTTGTSGDTSTDGSSTNQ
jgi:hypothetical protein